MTDGEIQITTEIGISDRTRGKNFAASQKISDKRRSWPLDNGGRGLERIQE
jgi:hypothetical protein